MFQYTRYTYIRSTKYIDIEQRGHGRGLKISKYKRVDVRRPPVPPSLPAEKPRKIYDEGKGEE